MHVSGYALKISYSSFTSFCVKRKKYECKKKTKKLTIRIVYILYYKSYIFQIYGRSTRLVGR